MIRRSESERSISNAAGMIRRSESERSISSRRSSVASVESVECNPAEGVFFGERNDATGMCEGYGRMEWLDGSVYEGQFKDGKFDGIGKMRWPDGDEYEGEYTAGQKEGRGIYRWADGDVYDGMWSNGCRAGAGAFAYSDGRIEVGRYRRGSEVGDVICWSADRQQAWRMTEDGLAELINLEAALAVGQSLGFSQNGCVTLKEMAQLRVEPPSTDGSAGGDAKATGAEDGGSDSDVPELV